jgi:hypothetical protein
VKKIDPCWSSQYTDHHFGIENIQSLHLCNMMTKQQDGYYEIFHEEHLCKLVLIVYFIFYRLSEIVKSNPDLPIQNDM